MKIKKILFVNPSLENHLYLDYDNAGYRINIDEGIYKTYPPSTARKYIINLFNLDESQIQIYGANGSSPEEKRLWVVYYNGYGNREKMEKAMRLCGYTISKHMERANNVIEEIYIPITLPNLNDIVRKYSFITHITPFYNKEKILRIGFVPKSKNEMFSYTDRVFFFKGDTPINEIIFQAFEFDNRLKNKKNNHIYTIFTIDTNKIPNNVSFHTDLTYPCGIYTTDNIPPNCIKGYTDFNAEQFAKQYLNVSTT
jgi:hypothetical protein